MTDAQMPTEAHDIDSKLAQLQEAQQGATQWDRASWSRLGASGGSDRGVEMGANRGIGKWI